MKQDNIIKKIWLCIYPLIFWAVNQFVAGFLFQLYFLIDMTNKGKENLVTTQSLTEFTSENIVLILLITSVINILFFSFMLKRNNKLNIGLNCEEGKIPYIISLIVMGISFFMFSSGIIDMFDLTKYSDSYATIINSLSSGGVIFNIIAVGIVAPVSEELMIRGVIYNNLKKYITPAFAVFIQAFLFGIMHMNIIQSTYAIFAGLILGYVYEKSGSLLVSSIFHISFNISNHLFSIPLLSHIAEIPLLMLITGVILLIYTFKYFNKKSVCN